jgi:hypothetical protein
MVRTFSFPLVALLLAGSGCAGQSANKPADATASTAAPASSNKLTPAERDAALKDLETTRQAFVASIKGLNDAQMRWKPSPDRWSVAEVAEHIAISEERLFGMITQKIMIEPPNKDLLAQVDRDDDKLRRAVVDRSTKRQAPEMLLPAGKFQSADAVSDAFQKSRDKAVTYVQTTQDDLRGHAMPHPLLKALDAYQWVILMAAHTARHTAQIEEVKADAKFPK